MMKIERRGSRFLFALLAFSLASVHLFAQAGANGGVIVYAEGKEFSVVREGSVKSFVPDDDAYAAFELRDGDLLQTGAGTFVEVQLKPAGTMLKVAENSSFAFQRIGDAKGETRLSLLYGRVRAKVAKVAGNVAFSIRSRQTVAGVRGTDFGFDSVVTAGAAASLAVYAFAGEIAVLPLESEAGSPGAELPLKAGEMVAFTESGAIPVVERRAVDAAIRQFWSVNDFKGSPPLSAPAGSGLSSPAAPSPAPPKEAVVRESAPKEAPEGEIRYAAADFRPYRNAIFAKNASIATSLVFTVASFALQAFGTYQYSSGNSNGAGLIWAGAAVGGLSLITLVSALLVPTPAP